MAQVFSAGIVPVRKFKGKYKFLVLRNRGYWDFPKGKLDEGETHIQAALRETKEECALEDFDFIWGEIYKETAPYPSKNKKKKAMKIARYYVAYSVSGDAKIVPNPETGEKEHDDLQWLTYKQALKLPLHDRIREILDWAKANLN